MPNAQSNVQIAFTSEPMPVSSGSFLSLKGHIRRIIRSRSQLLASLGALTLMPIGHQALAQDGHWYCRAHETTGKWECEAVGDIRSVQGNSKTVPAHRHPLDWVPEDKLTAKQKEQMAPGCCGAYIEPASTDADAKLNPEQAKLKASADKTHIENQVRARLEGNVRLQQGSRRVFADQAILDRQTQQASLEGNITLREPGQVILAKKGQFNLATGAGELSDAQFAMHESGSRGSASSIQRDDNGKLILSHGSYTQCTPDSNAWNIQGSEIAVDPIAKSGTAKHVRLNIQGIPVMYMPYIWFPIHDQRQSGVLYPSISSSDSGGVDFALPVYLNLAPNYDMTVTPRFIDDRGSMLELETRHLSAATKTTVSGAFLSNDDGGDDDDDRELVEKGLITEAQANPFAGEDRWLGSLQHQGGQGHPWYTHVDYTKVSDVDYFRDLDTASLEINSQTHLLQTATAGYSLGHWWLSAKAVEYQSLVASIAEPYRQRPRIDINGNYRWSDLKLQLNHHYIDFDHDEADSLQRLTGTRLRADYKLEWDKRWTAGFFKPAVAVKHLSYDLDDQFLNPGAEDAPNLSATQYSLDAGLFFERTGTGFGGYLQTFEPRLFYFNSDPDDHDDLYNVTVTGADVDFDTSELTFSYNQLFRDSRFSGGDRIDDANQLSLGLTTRFISETSGYEVLRLSLGQIYFFDDREISLNQPFAPSVISNPDATRSLLESQLNSSDAATRINARNQLKALNQQVDDSSAIALQLAGQISEHLRYSTDLLWDNEFDEASRGTAALRYSAPGNRIFYLGYNYQRRSGSVDSTDIDGDGITNEIQDQDIEQGDIAVMWPLAENWQLFARANYDFTYERELENLVGLEYNSCCYKVRLLGRRWIDNDLLGRVASENLEYDQGIFFEFQLKGLGGVGKKVSSILRESITGFEPVED